MTTRPHDALFKAAFEVPAHAEALFRAVLPAAVCDALDWGALRRESASFIDPALGDLHGDLLFSLPRRDGSGRVLIYLLAEHQSSPDPAMPLRLLGYLVQIWNRERKEHPGTPLPVVIPVVISHAPGGWTAPASLAALFMPEATAATAELAEFLPRFRVIVEDLGAVSNEAILARVGLAIPRLVWWVLRDARDRERLLANLPAWGATLDEAARTDAASLVQILSYLAAVNDQLQPEEFRAKLLEDAPAAGEVTMSWTEQWLREGQQKGREEGLKEGLKEGRQGALRQLLRVKFGPLAPELDARISAATESELDRYLERVLVADTAAAVFAP